MAGPEDDDVGVLGSGEAGKYLAWTLAAEGQRAAVIERKCLGGSCPNLACLPRKNVIHGAKVASASVGRCSALNAEFPSCSASA